MTRRKTAAEGPLPTSIDADPAKDQPATAAPDPAAATEVPPPPKRRRRGRRGALPASDEVDRVRVSDDALATLIGLAAHEVPGVVGMAPAGLGEGLRRILGLSQVDEGVEVDRGARASGRGDSTRDDGAAGAATAGMADGANVVLHVVVAYGVNIPAVAESVVERVRYAASTFAGVDLAEVKVRVAGVSRG